MKFLLTVSFIILFSYVLSFDVVWNVPTQQCRDNYKLDFPALLRQYGIAVNDMDRFQGVVITVFYDSQLGLYPKFLRNGTAINGGSPQLANLNAHLEKAKWDLQNVPSKQTLKSGLRVIDWESWRPTWEFNWSSMKIYQDIAKQLVRKNNPSISNKEADELAETQWETTAKNWMLQTLLLAEKIQPKALWGYYLFPDCYNYEGNSPQSFQCSSNIKKGNDKLKWLWDASTALFPSVYVTESQMKNYSAEQRVWFTNGRLQEALRVANDKAKIYAYINYDIVPGQKLPKAEFWRLEAQAASLGLDGIIIWGSSASVSNETLCLELRDYIIEVIGPASEKVKWKASQCTKEVCNGVGKCTWLNDSTVVAWKIFAKKENSKFFASEIQCKCQYGFTGRFCDM